MALIPRGHKLKLDLIPLASTVINSGIYQRLSGLQELWGRRASVFRLHELDKTIAPNSKC